MENMNIDTVSNILNAYLSIINVYTNNDYTNNYSITKKINDFLGIIDDAKTYIENTNDDFIEGTVYYKIKNILDIDINIIIDVILLYNKNMNDAIVEPINKKRKYNE